MMPYFLRHYSTFAAKIVVYDENSTDGTRDIIKQCPIAELRDWPGKGLDDDLFTEAVNHIYREASGKFDWVAWPDVDELLWHPNMLKMLAETKADMLQATGWGMISATGLSGQSGQIYDHFRHGVRQLNYDKYLLWRPSVEIRHTLGRHTYSLEWPKCSGVKAPVPDLQLLHYRFLGLDKLAARNRRNYARCLNKTYGWNSAPKANADPNQGGGVAWAEAALRENRLVDVFTGKPTLKKLHLGCGSHQLLGWDNHDLDVDIRKRLPYADNSTSHILLSHTLEHVTHRESWAFMEEARRVLAPRGILRIAIPDISKLSREMTAEYQQSIKDNGFGDGTRKSALKACVFCHGHQAAWNAALLVTFLHAVGFSEVRQCECGKSQDPTLCNCELHGSVVGESVAQVETSVVEAIK
jgi:SAM-dependent methyltransferase